MLSRSRSTAPAGAAASSSAQDNPPNAIMLVEAAALTNVTNRAKLRRPAAASSAIIQKIKTFAESTTSRLHNTGRSRKRVAFHCKSSSRRRWEENRSTTQPARPKSRNSFAEGASTARR